MHGGGYVLVTTWKEMSLDLDALNEFLKSAVIGSLSRVTVERFPATFKYRLLLSEGPPSWQQRTLVNHTIKAR